MKDNAERAEKRLNQSFNSIVLLVDDCRLQQHVLTQMLAQYGLDTECASSVNDALQYIESLDNRNLLISDIELPDNSGLYLVKALRDYQKNNSTLCIAISSNNKYQTSALMAGFDAFLTKPVSKQELANTLSNFNFKEKKSVQFYKGGKKSCSF